MKPIASSPAACRKFLRRVLCLDTPLPDAAAAIHHHGYVQLDPIDVCGRMHDLILRNRVQGYSRDGVLETLHPPGRREFFEHYLPGRGILVALPVDAYPFLLPHMRSRRRGPGYGGALTPAEKRLAARILARLREEGPLAAADFAGSGRGTTGWGTHGTLTKITLDKLFFHGRVLIHRRRHFRRVYDLPERVLPPEIAAARPAPAKAVQRWLARERLRQRRLATLPAAMAKLIHDEVTTVKLPGQPLLHCLRTDAETLAAAEDWPEPAPVPLLLGPLDPLLYDRTITRRLWNFDYTWEVYTPPAQRVRGYYALPVLAGTKLVGHVDPKADRRNQVLHARVAVAAGVDVTAALRDLTRFLGLQDLQVTRVR